MEGFHATHHVAVYDYGMGGIWVQIEADSAELIERRYPQLRVVTVGDPEWVSAAKYSEIVTDWIGPNMRFPLEHPSGWLAASDGELSAKEPR